MNIIHVYTRQQGIADGVLLPIEQYLASHEHGELLLTLLSKINTTFKRDFALGELVITANAARELLHIEVLVALARHQAGDWGELCEEDRAENERALEHGHRVFSVYCVRQSVKFYIITEWNREATTVLLPEDY